MTAPQPPDSTATLPVPAALTPAMRQYFDAKRQHRQAIVFFRMGDFYEMFYEDALVAARALELTLTSRSKDASGTAVPMCGIPYHAADTYITRLVRKGYRVAICEQVEDPRKAKGVVRREVVRVVSPGTLTDPAYLEAREPAFLMSIVAVPSADRRTTTYGVGLIDLSTGQFDAAEYTGPAGVQALRDEMAILQPREIVIPPGLDLAALCGDAAQRRVTVTEVDGWHFELASARQTLLDQLQVGTLEGFGLERRPAAVVRRRRPAPAPARHAEGRSRACPRCAPARSRRRPAHRPDDARTPRGGGRGAGRARGIAAARGRPHGHADGRPAAFGRGCCAR